MTFGAAPVAAAGAVFVIAAAVTWVAGIWLSRSTNALDSRLQLGSAMGGLILLAVATNLPELAVVVTAAVSRTPGVAAGNILGGIAMQTLVLAVLDLGVRSPRPLSYRASSLTLVLEAVMVILILATVIAASQLSRSFVVAHLSPDGLLITALWVADLWLVHRSNDGLPWQERYAISATQAARSARMKEMASVRTSTHVMSTRLAWLAFGVAALATLIAGVALEQSGAALADRFNLSGVIFGATVLSLATSLPEVSTGLAAVRSGEVKLAVSDIFGGNAFLPVLFLIATLISGTDILASTSPVDVYLTAIAILVTGVYAVGLLFRPRRRIAGMGLDSWLVILLYGLGIVGLFAVSGT